MGKETEEQPKRKDDAHRYCKCTWPRESPTSANFPVRRLAHLETPSRCEGHFCAQRYLPQQRWAKHLSVLKPHHAPWVLISLWLKVHSMINFAFIPAS